MPTTVFDSMGDAEQALREFLDYPTLQAWKTAEQIEGVSVVWGYYPLAGGGTISGMYFEPSPIYEIDTDSDELALQVYQRIERQKQLEWRNERIKRATEEVEEYRGELAAAEQRLRDLLSDLGDIESGSDEQDD